MNDKVGVIVLGADHHNTLAVIRCLGRYSVPFDLIVTSSKNQQDIRIIKSKYVDKFKIVEEKEDTIVNILLDMKSSKEKKPIIPCTDFTALLLDLNAEVLSAYFCLPGFQNDFGRVAFFMDKYNQKILADEYHIPMAKSWKCVMEGEHFLLPSDIVYPCILKPLISAYGSKNDIMISNSEQEARDALRIFEEKKYRELIVQEFLIKQYECCAYGCIVPNNKKYYGGVVRKLREFPPNGGGSLTYEKFIQDRNITGIIENIQEMLWKEKYSGLYDIELLVCKNGIYLNEINFRHSGNGYALIKNGIPAPYIWYISSIGKEPTSFPNKILKETYHMDEINEVTHLKANNVSMVKFVKSVLQAKAFSVFDIKDLRGTWAFYRPFAVRLTNKFFRCFRR